jgi:enoyl-[acyl-carrier-protein] reductase (NADH)
MRSVSVTAANHSDVSALLGALRLVEIFFVTGKSGMSQPAQQQETPGTQSQMTPKPDCGEESYRGSGKMTGKVAVITGGDSGIGRAVAIAFAREGADILIAYLSEDHDAQETASIVAAAGRSAVLVKGDVSQPQHCRNIIAKAVEAFGRLDVLVSNAAYQMTRDSLEDIPDEEWDYTFATNISAMFHLCKAAVPHMAAGSAIIGSSQLTPTCHLRRWHLMRQRKQRSRTFVRASLRCWGKKAFG